METQKVDFHSDTESEIDRGEVRGNIVWKGNQYPIFEGENIIGREDDCDVTIEHDSVSLKHAVLDYENGIAIMRDLKSKNGTSLESSAGSGNYIKLGPTRRNEQVSSGCKIRFGLVDCKYIAVEIEEPVVESKLSETKKDLKYDCETQFINLAAPESEDEDEAGHLSGILNKSASNNSAYDHSYDRPPPASNPFSASFDRGSSRSTVLEMETQLDQDLNSAEKAQVRSDSTPSSIFSSRLVHGIASGGIESPAANSRMSTPSAIPLHTAANTGDSSGNSTKNSSRSATPIVLPIARDDTPATAVGDDSTEDDGLNDFEDEDRIEIPIPSFHPVGIAEEPLSDGSDEESDMSQDLMRAEDDPEEGLEHGDAVPADPVHPVHPVATVPTPAPTPPPPQRAHEPQEDIPTDDEADENDENASVDFKLAQDDAHAEGMDVMSERAVSRAASLTASTNAPTSSDSPFHNMASADSRLSAPMDILNEDTNHSRQSAASNAHGLILPSRSNSIVLEANTEPQEFFTAPDPPTAPSVFANASPAYSSTSPTISGSERERAAQDLRTSVRSPGAAIRELLKNSAIPEGVKVFRSQGGLVEADGSASPAMSSPVSCSLPPDAPPMNFDFSAVTNQVATSSNEQSASRDKHDVEDSEDEVMIKQTKAKTTRGKKRIFDEESDEEFDEPLRPPVAITSSSSEPPSVAKSAVKRSRTNPRATPELVDPVTVPVVELTVQLAAMEEVAPAPAVPSAPSTARKTAGRGRKTPSPAPIVDEVNEGSNEPQASAKKTPIARKGRSKLAVSPVEGEGAAVVVEEVQAPVPDKTPAKRGRGKAALAKSSEEPAQPSSDETEPQVVETVVPVVPTTKAAAKRGRGKSPVEDGPTDNSNEPEVSVEANAEPEPEPVPAAVTKTPAKRGKVTIAESTPEQIPAAPELEPEAEVEANEALVSTSKAPKRGRGKAVVVEEPLAVEESGAAEPAVVEVLDPRAKTIKGRGRQSTVQKEETLPQPAVELPDVPVAEEATPAPKAAKKGQKRNATAVVEDNCESASAVAIADANDQEVRILFTKVDEAPYLKAIKSLPRASVTSDATVATHCVTLPELKRTPKLMVALNCGVKYVVNEQWIKDCVKAKAVVEVVKPADAAPAKKAKKNSAGVVEDARADAELTKQLQMSPYIVQDADKEKLWGFSMATTLSIPRNTEGGVKLFENMCFFCTKGVCGETAPPADELSTIIQSGGGIWLTSLEEWNQYVGTSSAAKPSAKSKAKSSAESDAEAEMPTLVVISHPSVLKKEVNKKVNDAIGKGNPHSSGVYSIELVFQACLKQRVEFESHQLK